MESLVRHRLLAGISLLAAILVASAAIAYANVAALRQDAQWVVHTHEVGSASRPSSSWIGVLMDWVSSTPEGVIVYLWAGIQSLVAPHRQS